MRMAVLVPVVGNRQASPEGDATAVGVGEGPGREFYYGFRVI